MQIDAAARLAPLTTLRLGGPAARLVTAETEADIVAAVREVDARGEPLLVLGGGSNLVVSDAGFPGTVVRIASRGTERRPAPGGDRELVTACAGEVWDDFVAAMVGAGLAGVECLGGIPGLVGAVPMQNVGAYGQDVSETIVRLRAYDRHEKKTVTIERDACAFGYRSSAFRGQDRFVILDVTFCLERSSAGRAVRYAELSRALGVAEGQTAPLALVRETVIALRRKKGMVLDPNDPDTTSAGSFFTNPILTPAELGALRERVASVPAKLPEFPEPDGRTKVSAAWLIEQAGFGKGFPSPDAPARVSTKHALALTNRGAATTADLVGLARRIRAGVLERFGVTLENEPVLVGVKL